MAWALPPGCQSGELSSPLSAQRLNAAAISPSEGPYTDVKVPQESPGKTDGTLELTKVCLRPPSKFLAGMPDSTDSGDHCPGPLPGPMMAHGLRLGAIKKALVPEVTPNT